MQSSRVADCWLQTYGFKLLYSHTTYHPSCLNTAGFPQTHINDKVSNRISEVIVDWYRKWNVIRRYVNQSITHNKYTCSADLCAKEKLTKTKRIRYNRPTGYRVRSVHLRSASNCNSTHDLSSSTAQSTLQNLITPNRIILDSQYSILSLAHLCTSFVFLFSSSLNPHLLQLSFLHSCWSPAYSLLSMDVSFQLWPRIHLSQLFSQQVSQQFSYSIIQNTTKLPSEPVSHLISYVASRWQGVIPHSWVNGRILYATDSSCILVGHTIGKF